MSKPATDARLAAEAKGFTQVIGRGNASLITKDPSTGKCCYDGQVGGGWHYGNGLETDTAFVPAAAPWDFQMTKALYNVYALSKFSSGQIIKWVDPGSGQYVAFQPMALQWTNSLNQIQQISMPQSVAAQVNDDTLYWSAAYGAGRNFRYQASPLSLAKQLIIDSPLALPATSYDTLELNFIIAVSNGVNIMVDGAVWDKKTTKNTASAIAFQLRGGAVLWSFAVPTAWDSSGMPEGSTTGSMRLKKQGSSLYVSVRFPKSWIDSAVFPIVLDPTLDHQVGASADDGYWYGSYFSYTGAASVYGYFNSNITHVFCRWTGVTIPDDATIDTAIVSFKGESNGAGAILDGTKLHFCDAANPSAPTTATTANALALTTEYVKPAMSVDESWFNHPDMIAAMTELMSSYSYAAGAAVMAVLKSVSGTGNNYGSLYYWNQSGNVSGPKLHIEYTEAAAGGNPFYAYAQQ